MTRPSARRNSRPSALVLILAVALASRSFIAPARAFAPISQPARTRSIASSHASHRRVNVHKSCTKLHAGEGDDSSSPVRFSDSESTLLGAAGALASVIMLYSESVLFRTGCGLPAGPAGLVGAAEGVSYLGVVALVGFSLFTKVRTGSGLPAGPAGILGAAEGLAYLAVFAGFWVLVAQVTNYGYIPNAVPMEGGMCQ